MKKFKIEELISILLFTIVIWVSVSSLIQAFNCPNMTQTQLFLHIPKSFIGDWRCN
jgi:hypothetical protein